MKFKKEQIKTILSTLNYGINTVPLLKETKKKELKLLKTEIKEGKINFNKKDLSLIYDILEYSIEDLKYYEDEEPIKMWNKTIGLIVLKTKIENKTKKEAIKEVKRIGKSSIEIEPEAKKEIEKFMEKSEKLIRNW